MHPTNLLARHFRGLATISPTDIGICCVTGETTECVPRSDVIGRSFTDWNLLAAPDSEWIGTDVAIAWTYGERADGKKRDFCPERHACWYASETCFRKTNRADIREMVLHGAPDPLWAGWVTTSYKKHGSIRAVANSGAYGIWGFDDTRPDASDHRKTTEWWTRLRHYQDHKIGRKSLETGDAPPLVIRTIPLAIWMDFRKWVTDKLDDRLYRFLCYLLPSKEELKEIGAAHGLGTNGDRVVENREISKAESKVPGNMQRSLFDL